MAYAEEEKDKFAVVASNFIVGELATVKDIKKWSTERLFNVLIHYAILNLKNRNRWIKQNGQIEDDLLFAAEMMADATGFDVKAAESEQDNDG